MRSFDSFSPTYLLTPSYKHESGNILTRIVHLFTIRHHMDSRADIFRFPSSPVNLPYPSF